MEDVIHPLVREDRFTGVYSGEGEGRKSIWRKIGWECEMPDFFPSEVRAREGGERLELCSLHVALWRDERFGGNWWEVRRYRWS